MKKNQIKVGGLYSAKITDAIVPVRIDAERPGGTGWDATNMKTHRKVHIKSAAKLRGPAKVPGAASDAKATTATTDAPKAKDAAKTTTNAKDAKDAPKAKDAKPKATTPAKPAAAKEKKPKALSLLSAAAQILAGAKEPMNCMAIVEQVTEKKLWAPRNGGKTPHATLYAAMTREIAAKGKDARFAKVERGLFTANPGTAKKGA